MPKYRLTKEFQHDVIPIQVDMKVAARDSEMVVFNGAEEVTTEHDLSHAVGRFLTVIQEEVKLEVPSVEKEEKTPEPEAPLIEEPEEPEADDKAVEEKAEDDNVEEEPEQAPVKKPVKKRARRSRKKVPVKKE